MAKVRTFNPPPNWPPAPPGWTPPPAWRPDPAWGPPPPGWPLWVDRRANPRAWAWGFAAAGVWTVVFAVVAVAVVLRAGGTSDLAAEAIGAVVGHGLVVGLLTSVTAWVSPTRWRRWVYVLVALGLSFVLTAIGNLGQLASSR